MTGHFGDKLVRQIRNTKSFLCIGIDPHLNLIPEIFTNGNDKNSEILKVENFCFSLLDLVVGKIPAIKPQIAMFEQLGPDGLKLLSSICKYARSKNLLVIMDAKRGDIGSTSQAYANAYLGKDAPFPSDAITVNPWLGIESLHPFVKKAKVTGGGLFILVHTSNSGSKDLQEIMLSNGLKCYEYLATIIKPLIEKNIGPFGLSSIGIVSGATFTEQSIALRKMLPNAPFLIPGYGSQGASAKDASASLVVDTTQPGLKNFGLINASRSILFPEEAYLADNIYEWEKVILTKLQIINKELINL